jgi:hypothetical protein
MLLSVKLFELYLRAMLYMPGVVLGRGHLAGPCTALSYVERAILVLQYFFFQKKKKKKKINILKFENNSDIYTHFAIFFISKLPPKFFPLSLHLPIFFPLSTTKHDPPPSFSIFGQLCRSSSSGQLRRSSSSGCLPSPAVFQFRRPFETSAVRLLTVTNFLVPKTTTNGHCRSPSSAKTQPLCDLHLRPSSVFRRLSSSRERPLTRSPSSGDPFLAQISSISDSSTDLPHFCVFSVVFKFAFFSSFL